jgi:hypothetical protein
MKIKKLGFLNSIPGTVLEKHNIEYKVLEIGKEEDL